MLNTLTRLTAQVLAFLRRERLDRDLDEELESHLAMLTEDNVRRGMTPEQGRRAALIQVGGLVSIKEAHREIRGLPMLEALLQDLGFAFRVIAKQRWLSAAAIATLALGIGVNAIGFTIVNAAFFRGLPFEDSTGPFMLSWQNRAGRRGSVSHSELQAWRDQTRTFAGLAAFSEPQTTMNISDDRAMPEQVEGTWLTANMFGLLRQAPLLGRDFAPADDRAGAELVAVVSYDLWKSRYGGDPNVLGRSMRIDGRPATIIGVMPEGTRFPNSTEVWAPFVPTTDQELLNTRRFRVIGRLRDGASRSDAQADMNAIGLRTAAAHPMSQELAGVRVETISERVVGGLARRMFLTVMAAVGFVLFIACANVANLLLSRSASRAHEIAIRMALGATRSRVVQQLLVESVVLGVLGGSVGAILAVVGVEMFETAMHVTERPYWLVFSVDYVVLGYIAAICLVTGVLFGLAPALHISKANNNDVLKEGGRGQAGNRRVRWFSGTLVVAELALTIVLLAGAGLMVRSFIKHSSVDIGIRTEDMFTMRVRLPESKYPSADARRAFFARLESRLAAVPGVQAHAITTGVPPLDGGERLVEIDQPGGSDQRPQFVSTVTISPAFFDVVDRPLVRGRAFRETDGAPGSETVIINEHLATRFFSGADPIGRRLRFARNRPAPGQPPDVWRTVVGIAGPIKHGSPQDAYVSSVVYIPYRQDAPGAASLVVRSALPPASLMNAVRREVQAIDPDQPVFTIQTLDQLLAADRWPYRIFGTLFAVLAAIALVLSSVGLYAVMANAVTQRTQEIGVRMAMGAQPQQVSWLILKRGLVQLAIGLPLGLAGALMLGVVLQRMLVDTLPGDPPTLGAITILLTVVSIAACLLPARRATRVDPLITLRAQ